MSKKGSVQANLWNIVFFVLLVLLALVITILIWSVQPPETPEPDVVGGVFIGSVEDNGWNQGHYEGLKEVCEELDQQLEIVENVEEDLPACLEAVGRLIEEKGCRVIFLTSDGYGPNIKPVVDKYPDVFFYTVSPRLRAKNVSMYYGRIYQVRYLAGMLAGGMTKTNVLGFVAAKRNPQVIRDVNAFVLGAQSVNPKVQVKVRLTNNWADPEREREAAEKLVDESHADVLAYHTAGATTTEVARERGLYSVGYERIGSPKDHSILASIVFRWKALYRMILRDYLGGKTRIEGNYWKGVADGVVAIGQYSPQTDREVYRSMREAKGSFEDGWDVFLGEIRRIDGKVMCRADERIGDESLLVNMDWFVEGVVVEGDD